MEPTFRKPLLADKTVLNEFLLSIKEDYVPPFSNKERTEELNKIYSGKAKAIVAVTQQGSIAGYVAWEPYSKYKNYGYIANIAVHPQWRRKGISTKLRELAFEEMKKAGLKGVYYTTWHTNTAMIESSKKLGIIVVDNFLDESFRGPGGRTILYKKDF